MEGSVVRSGKEIHIAQNRNKDSRLRGDCGEPLPFITNIIGKGKCFSIIKITQFSLSLYFHCSLVQPTFLILKK
jgi:hypothetical protein